VIWVGKKKEAPKQANNEKNDSKGHSDLNNYTKYAGMGFQMLAIIVIFAWAGMKLDERSGNEKKIYTAILSLIGVIIGIYTALKDFIHKNDPS
jgi:hypothetical protein